MELHLSWKKVSLIFPPPFFNVDGFLFIFTCNAPKRTRYIIFSIISSVISQVEAVMDYAFTFSSTFSTHQNKHKASDWFMDWDQVKISELSWRKAAGFRSVRQGNQIICSSVGTCFTCRTLSSSSHAEEINVKQGHQFWKRSFRWQRQRVASSAERFSCSLLQCKGADITLVSKL